MTISELFHALETLEIDREEGLGSAPIIIKWGLDCQFEKLELNLEEVENQTVLVIECKDNFSTLFEKLKEESLKGKKSEMS